MTINSTVEIDAKSFVSQFILSYKDHPKEWAEVLRLMNVTPPDQRAADDYRIDWDAAFKKLVEVLK